MLALAMTLSPTVSVPLAFTSFRKFAAVRRCAICAFTRTKSDTIATRLWFTSARRIPPARYRCRRSRRRSPRHRSVRLSRTAAHSHGHPIVRQPASTPRAHERNEHGHALVILAI